MNAAATATGTDRAEDERAIRRVLYDYCDHVDAYRPDDIVALFTADATFDLGFGRIFNGRPELRELFVGLDRYRATSHHISNVVVEFDGPDTARVRSRVHAVHRFADTGQPLLLWGRYEDRFVRNDGRWALRHRVLRAAAELHAADLSGVGAPPLAPRWEPMERTQASPGRSPGDA